jgi:hypothetical protein
MALAGATPTKLGPNPFHNAEMPSFFEMSLIMKLIQKYVKMRPTSRTCDDATANGFLDATCQCLSDMYNELCNRVLTTSNGHKMAEPTNDEMERLVPEAAILNVNNYQKFTRPRRSEAKN